MGLRKAAWIWCFVCLFGNRINAQEANGLKWPAHLDVADQVSSVMVGQAMGVDLWRSFQSSTQERALGCEALRVGAVIGIAELTKLVVHRTRPDGSDRKSFFSEHTALAAVSSPGWSFAVNVPVTGYLRMAANKHYASDVAVGAGVGWVARRFICKGVE